MDPRTQASAHRKRNDAALKAAGIDGPRTFAQRATIVSDANDGPTGYLLEHEAVDRVTAVMPTPSPAEQRGRLLGLLNDMAAAGLTGGHFMDFAALLTPAPGNDACLTSWIAQVRAEDLPHLHTFTRGIDLDRRAVNAALTLSYHNGRTEGMNTKTKLIKPQMYGRADFILLRHHSLLGRNHTLAPPKVSQSRGSWRPTSGIPPRCRLRTGSWVSDWLSTPRPRGARPTEHFACGSGSVAGWLVLHQVESMPGIVTLG